MTKQAMLTTLALAATLAGHVEAQNLVSNSDFNLDATGWVQPFAAWTDLDADDCHLDGESGALELTPQIVSNIYFATASSPCFAVTPGQNLCWATQYLGGGFQNQLMVAGFSSATCAFAISSASSPVVASTGTFTELAGCTVVPGNVTWMALRVSATHIFSYSMKVDRFYAGRGERIFLDNFEARTGCRWE